MMANKRCWVVAHVVVVAIQEQRRWRRPDCSMLLTTKNGVTNETSWCISCCFVSTEVTERCLMDAGVRVMKWETPATATEQTPTLTTCLS